jgi:hypothetical protein
MKFIALSPHGVPMRVLAKLARCSHASYDSVYGPDGRACAALTPTLRRETLRSCKSSERRQLLAELFREWGPFGWNYLRRGGLALRAARSDRMLAQHRPYVHGMARFGREFLLKYYIGLARALSCDRPRLQCYFRCWSGRQGSRQNCEMTGAFAWPIGIIDGRFGALPTQSGKAVILSELGELHARRRHGQDTAEAEKLLKR